MTATRLYYTDATLRTFTARITALEDDGRTALLDRTAFYPTSGGQPHDRGLLGGVAVVDVIDREDDILHRLATPLTAGPGAEVTGEIDWPRRWDHMQQHSGQHLLSAVIEDMLGRPTVSVHFGADSSTLDVSSDGALDEARMVSIEQRVNALVREARPVTLSFEEAATAHGLRKPSDRSGEIRIVAIEGIDRSACGGTHVATTAEIGPILLRRQEKVRQGLRIEFVCGDRALARARRDLELLQQVARAFSGSIDETPSLVSGQAAALRELELANKRMTESLARYRAAELHAAAAPSPSGLRCVVEAALGGGADTSRALALALSALPQVVFVSVSQAPPSVLLATSADSGVEAGKVLKPLLELVGGRGGGSPRLAQGSVPTAAAADQVVERLTTAIRDGTAVGQPPA